MARIKPLLRKDAIRIGDIDMVLPEGKTCKDCVFFHRCNCIYGHIAEDEVCDWSPSEFCEPKKEVVNAKTD